jgi:arginase family enzyme
LEKYLLFLSEAVKRGGAGMAGFRALLFVLLYAAALPAFPAGGEKIPLLISDHHAEHGPFMLKYLGTEPDSRACMVVIDAHTDTAKNTAPPLAIIIG